MKLENVKIGDEYFGIIYKYKYRFLDRVVLTKFEIVKINKKTVGIAFNKQTRKHHQLMPRFKELDGIDSNPCIVLEKFLLHLESVNYVDYLKKKMRLYCQKEIRRIKEKNLCVNCGKKERISDIDPVCKDCIKHFVRLA